MVLVPEGEFVMGAPWAWSFDDESPDHVAWLPDYEIDATEVTIGEFERSPIPLPRQPRWNWDRSQPVLNVTWYEAVEYCEWAGKRLPTEAEWEKAARGTDARRHPWGGDWAPGLANTAEEGDSHDAAAPVGSFPDGASPYGAFDMAGNAWEWTADWYDADYYARSPRESPAGPSRGSLRVARGGSFLSREAQDVRSTVRLPLGANERREDVGFRCVR